MKHLTVILSIAALMLTGAAANAALFSFSTILSGAEEVPPVATQATGFGTFLFDDEALSLSCSVNFYNLTAPSTVAHIHAAPAGTNGAAVFPLFGGAGLTTGYYVGIWEDMTPTDVANLWAGGLYTNIHSEMFPGGEIRGQIRPCDIPELPASALALIPGLLALVRRRR